MEQMTESQLETFEIADKIVLRSKKPTTEFRLLRGWREERAITNGYEFFRDQCAILSAALLEKDKTSMSIGEPE